MAKAERPGKGKSREAARAAKRNGEYIPAEELHVREETNPEAIDAMVENGESLSNNIIWINQQRALGQSDSDIISVLREQEWDDSDIMEMLTEANLTRRKGPVDPIAMGQQMGDGRMQQLQQQQQAQGDPDAETSEKENQAERREGDVELVQEAALSVHKYRQMRVPETDILRNLKERGLAPAVIANIIVTANAIDERRAERERQQFDKKRRGAAEYVARQKEHGSALGQVETKSGTAWAEPQDQAPLGREMPRNVPTDEGPLIQVETKNTPEDQRKRLNEDLRTSIVEHSEHSQRSVLDRLHASLRPQETLEDPLIQVETHKKEAHAPSVDMRLAEDIPVVATPDEGDADVDSSHVRNPFRAELNEQAEMDDMIAVSKPTEGMPLSDVDAAADWQDTVPEVPTISGEAAELERQEQEAINQRIRERAHEVSEAKTQPYDENGEFVENLPLRTKMAYWKIEDELEASIASADEAAQQSAMTRLDHFKNAHGGSTVRELSSIDDRELKRQQAVDEELAKYRAGGWEQSMPEVEEKTPREWKMKLAALIEGAKDKLGGAAESVSAPFSRAREYLGARSTSLVESIANKFGRSREALKNGKERAKALKDYIAARDKSLAEKAKTLGKGAGENLMRTGEWYRALPLKYKIGLSAALLGTSLATGGASTLVTILSAAKLGQRSLNALATYTLVEGIMEKRISRQEAQAGAMPRTKWDSWKKHGTSTAAALAVFSGLPGFALKEGFEYVGGGRLVEWLGGVFGHHAAPELAKPVAHAPALAASHPAEAASQPGAAASAPASEASAAVEHAQQPASASAAAAPAEAPAHVGTAEAAAQTASSGTEGAEAASAIPPEVAQLDAKAVKGHGYEWMMKRLVEKVPEGFDASKLPEGSDLRRLLEAQSIDAKSLDTEIHNLSMENKVFNADGTSVLITPDAHLSIDNNGNIALHDKGYVGNYPLHDSPVTPEYHAPSTAESQPYYGQLAGEHPVTEVPDTMPATVDTIDVPVDPSVLDAPVAPSADITHEAIGQQPAAPLTDHDFVINKYDVTVPLAEPNLYQGVDGTVYAYGGTAAEQKVEILKYLQQHPDTNVTTADPSGKYRIGWLFHDNKVLQTEPMKTKGFLGIFNSFMPPPSPDELAKVIK